MRNLFHKIRGKKGESLLESLVAILIFTLASIAMFSSVMTANNINRETKEYSKKIEHELNDVEKADVPKAGSSKISIEYAPAHSGVSTVKVAEAEVYVFGDPDSGKLYSYFSK